MSETPSNLAFGDPDFSTLYVTARTSVYRIRAGREGGGAVFPLSRRSKTSQKISRTSVAGRGRADFPRAREDAGRFCWSNAAAIR